MNRETILLYLENFFASLLYHPDIKLELVSLLTASGFEKRFLTLLIKRIQQLATYGINATNLEEFELLNNGLYSMHLAGKGFNIRILYSFLSNRKPVLLLAFYERWGKRKTDYTPYFGPVKLRLEHMREVFENDSYRL